MSAILVGIDLNTIKFDMQKSVMMQKKWVHSALLGMILATAAVDSMPVYANGLASLFGQSSGQPKFLPVDQAFAVTPTQVGDELVVKFAITPKHYVYQDRLSLKLPEGVTAGEWQFDKAPSIIDDPTFGVVPVFEEDVTARVQLSATTDIQQPIGIRWQGCAKAGLCYPPETTTISMTLMSDAQQSSTIQTATQPSKPEASPDPADDDVAADEPVTVDAAKQTDAQNIPAQPDQPARTLKPSKQAQVPQSAYTYTLDHQLPVVETPDSSPMIMILLLFLAGLLLAFTPCIYPMVPIVANIVAKQHAHSAKRGFMLSAAYGVGVATAYGVLGALIAWFGQALGIAAWLQRAEVLMVAAALFVFFALMMFGWVNVRLPSAISNKLAASSQAADGRLGTLGGSYLSGLLSALVVSPCVSAPMAGALTMVAASGQVWFGFLALFMLGLGLSVPLMLLGALQAKWMPKTGAWMQHIRTLGGFLLLAVALLLIERVLLTGAMLGLWVAWFVALALWLLFGVGRHSTFAKIIAIIPMLWAGLLIYGMSIGSTDAWRPWHVPQASQAQSMPDIKAYTLDELDGILKTRDRVLVDVTADWCIECRIMDRTLFGDRPDELHEYQVVKLDISETTDHSRAILARYELFGPPALLIYHQGKLTQVLLGETKPAAFKAALAQTP